MYGNDTDTDEQSTGRSTIRSSGNKNVNAPASFSPIQVPPSLQPRTNSNSNNTENIKSFTIQSTDNEEKNELKDINKFKENESELKSDSSNEVINKNPKIEQKIDTNNETEFDVEGDTFVVIHNFKGEKIGDLTITIGENLNLLETRDDGWWKCSNKSGEIGLVPKNVLQLVSLSNEMNDDKLSLTPTHSQSENKEIENNDIKESEIFRDIVEIPPGDFIKIDKNDHYGLACHLFPRLSESNLHFHDVFWYYSNRDKCYLIRKRKVKFCKLIKVYGICQTDYHTGLDADFYLYDTRISMGRQIVSNIFSSKIRVNASDSFSFLKSNPCSFILRSNYNLFEVVLRTKLHHQNTTIGTADIRILNNNKTSVKNGKYTIPVIMDDIELESKKLKIVVQIQDIPSNLIANTDGLPDVLLCEEKVIPLFYAYRNLLADYLATCQITSIWISDPVISTFPIAATYPDLMDILLKEVQKIKQQHPFQIFRYVYIKTILPLIMTVPIPKDKNMKNELFSSYLNALKKYNSPVEFLSSVKCKPVDPFDYVVDLNSIHSLD